MKIVWQQRKATLAYFVDKIHRIITTMVMRPLDDPT